MKVPQEIRVHRGSRTLELVFAEAESIALGFELLRISSLSAEVRGHGTYKPIPVAGKSDVGISGVVNVGRYGIQIQFDDGHDTGIYSWGYLLEIHTNQEALWQKYLADLEETQLSRFK